MSHSLAILGAGNMAEAIARGVFAAKLYRPAEVVAADPSPERRAVFAATGVTAVETTAEAVRGAKTILLSVKPQSAADVLSSIGEALGDGVVVVSIMAGKTSRWIESNLPADKRPRVVRVMPNTPMLVGEGAAGIACGSLATADDRAFVRRMRVPKSARPKGAVRSSRSVQFDAKVARASTSYLLPAAFACFAVAVLAILLTLKYWHRTSLWLAIVPIGAGVRLCAEWYRRRTAQRHTNQSRW